MLLKETSSEACRDRLASTGQQDSRQDRDSDTPSPSGFILRSSSSRHFEWKRAEKANDHESQFSLTDIIDTNQVSLLLRSKVVIKTRGT